MADSGTGLLVGKQVVATAGTRVRLKSSGSNFAAKTVIIQALGTNEGEIVVGGPEVVAKAGSHATPEQEGIALAAKALLSIDVIDAAWIWLDTTKSGDGVSYMVLQA